MLLDQIKIVGIKCPLCANTLRTLLTISVESNRYSYHLANDYYPLSFERYVPFGGDKNKIIINEEDVLMPSAGISSIHIQTICSKYHYIVSYFNFGLVANFSEIVSLKRDTNYNYTEEIRTDKFVLKNNKITTVYKKSKATVDRIGRYHLGGYDKLFSIAKKPIDFWPLGNELKLEEKINKLLLLI